MLLDLDFTQTAWWLFLRKCFFFQPFFVSDCHFPLSHSLPFYDRQHRNASARPISPLMAVITPYFPSMSLIHLMVGFPLCCCPSILIKPELNDQQWLCAGAHPSQHVSERPPVVMWAHTYKPVQTIIDNFKHMARCSILLKRRKKYELFVMSRKKV